MPYDVTYDEIIEGIRGHLEANSRASDFDLNLLFRRVMGELGVRGIGCINCWKPQEVFNVAYDVVDRAMRIEASQRPDVEEMDEEDEQERREWQERTARESREYEEAEAAWRKAHPGYDHPIDLLIQEFAPELPDEAKGALEIPEVVDACNETDAVSSSSSYTGDWETLTWRDSEAREMAKAAVIGTAVVMMRKLTAPGRA